MRRLFAFALLALASAVAGTSEAQQTITFGEAMADFPPGLFTDGGKYQLSDFKGKILVLYFFEPTCESCRKIVANRNEVINAMRGKPVAFVGVAANVGLEEAAAFQQATNIAMPLFADNLGVMQARYGDMKISLENIYQTRVIDPEGKVIGIEFKKEPLELIVARTRTESIFQSLDLDARFAPVRAPFEHGQFPMGLKLLANVRRTAKKNDIDGLNKIQAAVKKEAAKWKSEADMAAASAPLVAYDLYSRAAATFPTDDVGKASQKALKALAADPKVKAELPARTAYAKAAQAMSVAVPAQKAAIAAAFADIAKKYPETPTGMKALTLAEELGYVPPKKK